MDGCRERGMDSWMQGGWIYGCREGGMHERFSARITAIGTGH